MNEKKSKKTTNIIILGICIICIIILGIIALLFFKKNSDRNDSLLTKVVGSWYANIVEVYNEDLDEYETRGLSQYFGNEIVESNELIFNSDNTFKCEFLNDSGKYEIANNKIYMLSNIKEASYKAELNDEELVLILEDNTKIYLSKEKKNDNSDNSNEKKAEQILFNEFGEKDELTGNQYSYNYIGIFKDKKSKEYYVFDLKWLVDNNHVSSIGYYAVSLENNDYYFINNTDFKETGIIEIEPKVIKDESDNKLIGKVLSSPKNNKYGEYVLALSNYKKNDIIQYNLNDKYKIVVEITDEYKNDVYQELKIYVNNDFLVAETYYDQNTITFSILDYYLFYITNDLNVTHHNDLYIYQLNNLYVKLSELEDEVKGMGVDSYKVDSDKLIVYGTRLADSDVIEHPEAYENVCNLDKGEIISATYTFEFIDGFLEMEYPSKTNKLTFEEFNQKNKWCN